MAYPAFYCTQTLLGGVPDRNRRTIYAEDTGVAVKTYNYDMKPWTWEMEADMDRELKALNELAGSPRKILPTGTVMFYGLRRQ